MLQTSLSSIQWIPKIGVRKRQVLNERNNAQELIVWSSDSPKNKRNKNTPRQKYWLPPLWKTPTLKEQIKPFVDASKKWSYWYLHDIRSIYTANRVSFLNENGTQIVIEGSEYRRLEDLQPNQIRMKDSKQRLLGEWWWRIRKMHWTHWCQDRVLEEAVRKTLKTNLIYIRWL